MWFLIESPEAGRSVKAGPPVERAYNLGTGYTLVYTVGGSSCTKGETVRKLLTVIGTLIIAAVVLTGCQTLFGRGHGPIDAFAFLPSGNSSLTQAVLGTINESPDPKRIEVVVPPGTDLSHLIATISLNKEATITVVSSGNRVVQNNGATPNDFQTPVLYSIEVPKDKDPWQYLVSVRHADTNPRLAALLVPGAEPISPAFNPAGTAYSVTVPYAATQARIEARAESAHLHGMLIDGNIVRGASAAVTVPFAGTNSKVVKIETTAEDGKTQAAYTLTIVRGEPDRNSALASLSVAGTSISPAFSPGQMRYVAQVPFAATTVDVAAAPQSKFATVAAGHFDFATGSSLTIPITVTAQDGSTSVYRLDVVRAAPDSNNLLSALSLGQLLIFPSFDPGQLSYSATIPYEAKGVALSARPQSQFATVQLGTVPGSGAGTAISYSGDPAGPAGATIDFTGIDHATLSIGVAAQDGSVRLYTIAVNRQPPDGNSSLGALNLEGGSLFPSFSPSVRSYTVLLAANQPRLTLRPVAERDTSTVSLDGRPVTGPQAYEVAPGSTRIVVIDVTAQNGRSTRYAVQVSRQNPPAQQVQPQQPVQPQQISMRIHLRADTVRLSRAAYNSIQKAGDEATRNAVITVRTYRSNDVLAQGSAAVDIRQNGKSPTIFSLAWDSNGVQVPADRLIEIEVAIPTVKGSYLHWTGVVPVQNEVSVDVPFLLYDATARVNWPQVGTAVNVDGVASVLNGGFFDAHGGHEGERPQSNGGSLRLTAKDRNGATGNFDLKWSGTGDFREAHLQGNRTLTMTEGESVTYSLDVQGKSGRNLRTTTSGQVWTTRLNEDGSFSPALIYIFGQLN